MEGTLVLVVMVVLCVVFPPLGIIVLGALAAAGFCRALEWFETGK